MTCTTSDAGVRIQVAADDENFISVIDPDPLPPGLPTFGVARPATDRSPCSFTDLVVNGPAS